MKKIMATAVAALLTIAAFAQDGKSIYNKYSDSKGVSAVYVSPAMFRMFGKIPDLNLGEDSVNVAPLIKSLNGLYLIDSQDEGVNSSMKKDVKKLVTAGDYEMMMEVKDSGSVVHLYTTTKGEFITGLVFIAEDGGECTFICLDGQMPRKDFENMISKAAE